MILAGNGFRIFIGVVLATAPIFISPKAHCSSVPPQVEISSPSDGVVIQKACYQDFGTCFTDTFYVDKLRQQLVANFTASKYAVVAYVDSISNYLTYDTTFYRGQIYYVDTFQTEKVWIGIDRNIKEPLPVNHLSYVDRWVAFTGNPYATTYKPLIDTPFVAFFSIYDSIRELGLGPMDGCFFEPTAYTIVDNRIHKKGLVGERMPGVSLVWEDFFSAIGLPASGIPPVHTGHTKILRPMSSLQESTRPVKGYRYDLLGKRSTPILGAKWNPWTWEFPRQGL
jgi:hypothetical protein